MTNNTDIKDNCMDEKNDALDSYQFNYKQTYKDMIKKYRRFVESLKWYFICHQAFAVVTLFLYI